MNYTEFKKLWEANKKRKWVKKLLRQYREKSNLNYQNPSWKNIETINHWREQYQQKHPMNCDPIHVSSEKTLEVGDGNHRLIALFLNKYNDLIHYTLPNNK